MRTQSQKKSKPWAKDLDRKLRTGFIERMKRYGITLIFCRLLLVPRRNRGEPVKCFGREKKNPFFDLPLLCYVTVGKSKNEGKMNPAQHWTMKTLFLGARSSSILLLSFTYPRTDSVKYVTRKMGKNRLLELTHTCATFCHMTTTKAQAKASKSIGSLRSPFVGQCAQQKQLHTLTSPQFRTDWVEKK